MQIDVVILSLCATEETFIMNSNCISSLMESETEHTFNVIVMESNKEFLKTGYQYPYPVQVIIPQEKFNYNKFLNIAIKQTNNEMICLCNNDLVFKKGWLTQILRIKKLRPGIQSFSPKDPDYKTVKGKFMDHDYYLGYEVGWEFFAACLLLERKVFEKTGFFDEKFDFYYQDYDFSMCLRKHSILHALVTKANFSHVYTGRVKNDFTTMEKLDRDKALYHQKWGSQRMIGIKNRLARVLHFFNLNFAVKLLYSCRN
ncbi:MAG: putative glycosyltransferase [Bacteroidetes bacterium]|nr:putative glycosyltransferase [Bacteroidota bacterium]